MNGTTVVNERGEMSLQEAKQYFENMKVFADERGRIACQIAISAIMTVELRDMYSMRKWKILENPSTDYVRECSVCGTSFEWNYCPNCGAKMRGE